MFFGRKSKTTADRHPTTRAPRSRPARPARKSLRPVVEGLEGRIAMTAPCNPLNPCFLTTPIPENAHLLRHDHVLLLIEYVHPTGVQFQTIPSNVGNVADKNGKIIGFDPIHTHDSSDLIHIESTVNRPFHLSDFFTIWHKPFSKNQVLDHKATPGHPILMYVAYTNGKTTGYQDWFLLDYLRNLKRDNSYGNLTLKDGQVILIVAT